MHTSKVLRSEQTSVLRFTLATILLGSFCPDFHKVDALQRIQILLMPSLAALLHHGVAILLGSEDGKLLGGVDLTLRHKFWA